MAKKKKSNEIKWADGGVINAGSMEFTVNTEPTSGWITSAVTTIDYNKPKYMIYGIGCNNKSDVYETENEMKKAMKTLNEDWTGRIIGYKLTPIYEAEKKIVVKEFKKK